MKTRRGLNRSGWNTALLIALPLMVMVFLGSQMALKQVASKSSVYVDMPEITQIAALRRLPPGADVMLRGRIVAADDAGSDLVIYQERPADGRAVRFREVFDQRFPAMELALADGRARVRPRPESKYIMRHAPHLITVGDRQQSGFRAGDVVTVQGRLQLDQDGVPMVVDVAGVNGRNKAELLSEWQEATRQVTWVSRVAGLLSALGLLVVILRMRQWWVYDRAKEAKTWRRQTTKAAPAASRL